MERIGKSGGSGALPRHNRQRGITLIELMIVVVIVAILGSLAVPSYRDYVLRSNRMEAINQLLDLAACQERIYIKFNEYDDTRCDLGGGAILTDNNHYSVTMAETNGGQGFTLTAAPQGGQTSDSCGSLTLTDTGVRTVSVSTSDPVVDGCWRGKKVSP